MTSLRRLLLRTATRGLGHHWCIWRSIGYVLHPSFTFRLPGHCARDGILRLVCCTNISSNAHQISVHQRYRGDELESFAVQYMSGKDNGRDCAKSTHGQHVSGFQDAFLIFGKDPSDRTHFVQHARALMSQNVRRVDAEPRATFKGITPRRRKKDPKRPKGYVSGFNFFVIDQTKALVRESKVMYPS